MKSIQVNQIIADLYQVKEKTFCSDLLISIVLSWALFIYSLFGEYSILSLIAATFFSYRGLSFIHELSHLKTKHRYIERLYNYLLVFPNRVPSYTHKAHTYHHNILTFGTIDDPEYEKWTDKHFIFLFRPILLSLLYPMILTIRFGIWPLVSILISKNLKLTIYKKASTFVMNVNYQRPFKKEDYKFHRYSDFMCSLYFLAINLICLYFNILEQYYFNWSVMVISVSLMNTYRALVAHRYAYHKTNENQLPRLRQLNDSVTIEGGILTELWAPLSLRYHSTHHFLPNLPYHSLAQAHKRLKASLPKDHPYHNSIEKNFLSAFTKLIRSTQSNRDTP